MSTTIKPQHYLVRPNGAAVALIAMDELPHNTRVEGVARILTHKDTINMTGIGEVESRHQTYQVYDVSKPSPRAHAVDTQTCQSTKIPSEGHSIPSPKPVADDVFSSPKKYYGVEEQPPHEACETAKMVSDASAVYGRHEPLPSWKKSSDLGPRLATPGKKIYCSHWMSTGECDYAQQGCLYKHEMPLDIKLLNALGYQDIPRWYRDKHSLGKLTAVPGSGAHIRGPPPSPAMRQDNWRSSSRNSAMRMRRSLPPRTNTRSSAETQSFGGRAARKSEPVRDLNQTDLLDMNDLSDSTSTTAATSQGPGLLNSKFAALSPSMPFARRNAIQPADSAQSGSDADHSTAGTQVSVDDTAPAQSCRANPLKPARPSRRIHNRNVPKQHGPRQPSNSRRESVASDYETELEERVKARDLKEAADYAIIQAEYKKKEEEKQAELEKAQLCVESASIEVS